MNEIGHSTLKGTATGLAVGGVLAAITQDESYIWHGAAYGARMAGLRIAPRGAGITLGLNVVVKLTGDTDYGRWLLHHETGHVMQINEMGGVKLYSRTVSGYTKHYNRMFGIASVYQTPGT